MRTGWDPLVAAATVAYEGGNLGLGTGRVRLSVAYIPAVGRRIRAVPKRVVVPALRDHIASRREPGLTRSISDVEEGFEKERDALGC
jgi:hypothetical protein